MPGLAEVLLTFGRESTEQMKVNLSNRKKNASNALSQSIDFSQRVFSNIFVLSIQAEDYYDVVDKGRRPGKKPPPYDPTTKSGVLNSDMRPFGWIQNKPSAQVIVNKLVAQYKDDHPNTKLTDAEIRKNMRRGFAYIVSRNISKNGIKGSNFFSDVINDRTLAEFDKKIDTALDSELGLDNILD